VRKYLFGQALVRIHASIVQVVIAGGILQVTTILPERGDIMDMYALSAVLELVDIRTACQAERSVICG
jgi:hypothetical protein